MKVKIWYEYDVEETKVGDVIKRRRECDRCGNIEETNIVTVIEYNWAFSELTVDNNGNKQKWDTLKGDVYLLERQ